MFSHPKNRVGGRFIAGFCLVLALVQAGMGQTTSVEENQPTASEPLEEIVVFGEK